MMKGKRNPTGGKDATATPSPASEASEGEGPGGEGSVTRQDEPQNVEQGTAE